MFEPIDRVMNMRKGGSAVAPRRTVIGGQDHMLSYITPQEGEILMSLGGSGNPGPMGIPSFADGGDANPYQQGKSFYLVPAGGSGNDQEYKKVFFGTDQDTMENRISGSSDLASVTQDMVGGPPQAVNRDEYLREYERRLAALQGRPDPYAEPDFVVSTPGFQDDLIPDPVVPDPVVPEDPSSIVVDPVEVVPELGNIPTSNYQPFVPDFTPPPVSSIEDVLADLKGVPLSSLPTGFAQGGAVEAPRRTDIAGQDHMLSYITPQEGEILMALGGSGKPGPMGIPAFDGDGPSLSPLLLSNYYRVPTGINHGQPDDQEYKKVYFGSDQDTVQNRMTGSSEIASIVQDAGPGAIPQAVNRDEYQRQYERDLAKLRGQPDPYPDPVPAVVPDLPGPVIDPPLPEVDPAPKDPSGIVVDPVEVVPELGNIPTSNYQPFVPDFTPPPVSSIEDVLADLKGVPLSSLPTGFAQGGAVEAPRRTDIAGQDHMLSYITPQEGEILMALGGSGEPGPMGIPAFVGGDDKGAAAGSGSGDHSGGAGSASGADTSGAADDDMGDDDIGGFSGGYNDDVSSGGGRGSQDTMDRAAAKDYGVDSYGQPVGRGAMGYAGRTGMSPGRSQAMFGIPGFAGLNVGSQKGYNARMGITDTNPYGKMGFFTRHFGIPTDKIDYTGIMGLNTRRAIANNQFSKFANPQNIRGAPGYNPSFATAKPGTVRAGVQKAGYNTKFGKVVERNRQMEVPEMVARGVFGLLAPGPMSLALSQIGTKEYGLPSLSGMERFGVKDQPPGLVGQIFGALTGGVPADQAYDKAKSVVGDLVDRMSSKDIEAVAKATPEQQQEIQAQLQGPPELTQMDTTQGLNQTNVAFGLDFPGTVSDTTGLYSTNYGTPEEAQKSALDRGFQGYNTATP